MTRSRTWRLAAALLAAAALLGVAPLLLRAPAVVARVSVVNPSAYDIHVDVTGEDRDGWVSVTTARRGSTNAGVDVVDQGEVWSFRFSAQGRHGGELRLTRPELREAGWSVEVPDAVIETLRGLGTPPSP